MSGWHRAQQGSSGGFSSPGIWPLPESTGSIRSARVRNQRETVLVQGGSAPPAWGCRGPTAGAPDSFAPGLLRKEEEEGFPAGDGGAAWDKLQVWQGCDVRWHQERWHQERWQGSRGGGRQGDRQGGSLGTVSSQDAGGGTATPAGCGGCVGGGPWGPGYRCLLITPQDLWGTLHEARAGRLGRAEIRF